MIANASNDAKIASGVEFPVGLSKACVICKARGENGVGHMADKCPHDVGREIWIGMERLSVAITYEKYSGCFECGLWQGICQSWVRNPANPTMAT